MFLGYQNDKIAFVANTREELENIPCVSLDRIEETGVDYVLKDGEYKPKSVADKETKTEETIARYYTNNGKIDLFSREGKGTTVMIWFPKN